MRARGPPSLFTVRARGSVGCVAHYGAPSEPAAPATGMMCAVRRHLLPLAGLIGLAALATAAAPEPAEGGTAAGSTPGVTTVIGRGQLDAPEGIALDAAGDLFVADTGHCRVLVVPARAGTSYGLHLTSGARRPRSSGVRARVRAPSATRAGWRSTPRGTCTSPRPLNNVCRRCGPSGRVRAFTVAGTGRPGFNGDGLTATTSQLDQPAGVAVDAAGDLFIADTANCRVRVLPARSASLFGRAVTAGHLATVAGTGICGTAGQGGPIASAQLWDPVAVTVDGAGDLLVADNGDQSVLLASPRGGTYYGTRSARTTSGWWWVGPAATGRISPTASPPPARPPSSTTPGGSPSGRRGPCSSPTGSCTSSGWCRRPPGRSSGRPMAAGDLYTVAGALPVKTAAGLGDGTRWVLTRMGTPVGIAVSPSGTVYYGDGSLDTVRAIGGA